MAGSLLAISDLHVSHPDNRRFTEAIEPHDDDDWLIVAGDVADTFADVGWALRLLRSRFRRVVWAPGNHELWTLRSDPVQLRGEHRYQALVELCRDLGVDTPEDPYPHWDGPHGPVQVAPVFVLYDYTFRAPGTTTQAESLAAAYESGVVCTDEFLLHPDPHPDRAAWCRARVAHTERRLADLDPALPTVLVSHWPLDRRPTEILRHPEFAQWCGTELTHGWHMRYHAEVAVYGHLHVPRTTVHDGVRFEEVSLGYPEEWSTRSVRPTLRTVLPGAPAC